MIRALVIVVQAILWLLLIRLLLRGLTAPFARAKGAVPPAAAPRQVRPPEDLVHDRVCDTYVPRSRAVAARVAGREEWFCSAACRDRALGGVARAS
jgi:hypothetical protein